MIKKVLSPEKNGVSELIFSNFYFAFSHPGAFANKFSGFLEDNPEKLSYFITTRGRTFSFRGQQMNTIEMQMNSNTMTQDSVIEPATTTTNDQDLNSLITRLMQTATATTSTEPNQARFVWRRNTRQWVKIVQTPRRKPFRGNASETANG